MFTKTFTALSTATPETLWPLYADVSRWKAWDEGVERVTLEGPFTAGTKGTLKMHDTPVMNFTLTAVTPFASFSDETRAGPLTVRFTHTLTRLFGGTRIEHTVTIEGPGAEHLGANMPVQGSVDALARLGATQTPVSLAGVIVYTPDVERAVGFYERAFGFTVARRSPGNVYVQLAGAVPLAFCEEGFIASGLPVKPRPNRPADAPAGAEVMLAVADVPAAFARAVEAGAVPFAPPVTKPWGQVVALVRDLDGVIVELCTPWA